MILVEAKVEVISDFLLHLDAKTAPRLWQVAAWLEERGSQD